MFGIELPSLPGWPQPAPQGPPGGWTGPKPGIFTPDVVNPFGGPGTPPASPTSQNVSINQSQADALAAPTNTGPPQIPRLPTIPWWLVVLIVGGIAYVSSDKR